jgi:hypothetical protein
MTSPEMTALAPLFSLSSPSDRELREIENCSAIIAQMKARHKAEPCSRGMTGQPECRSLETAMQDIRRKAEASR